MPSHDVKAWQKVLFARGYTATLHHGNDNVEELEKLALSDFEARVKQLQVDPILHRIDVPRIHPLDLPLQSGVHHTGKRETFTGKQCLAAQKQVKQDITSIGNPVWIKHCNGAGGNWYPSGQTNTDICRKTLHDLWVHFGGLSEVIFSALQCSS